MFRWMCSNQVSNKFTCRRASLPLNCTDVWTGIQVSNELPGLEAHCFLVSQMLVGLAHSDSNPSITWFENIAYQVESSKHVSSHYTKVENLCIPRIPLCIVHSWCTELSLCSQFFVTSSIWLFLACKYGGGGKVWISSHVQRCQENQKEDTWEPLSHYTKSQPISPPDTGMRLDSAKLQCTVGLPCN